MTSGSSISASNVDALVGYNNNHSPAMSSQALQPGKTAPKLLYDINQFNGFTDPCQHDFYLNQDQSTNNDVVSICTRCRIHVRIQANHHNTSTGRRPCPNNDYPLHHFVCKSELGPHDYEFQCTSPDCGTVVRVQYTPPSISASDVDLLTNEDLLKKRYEDAVHRDTTRSGFIIATPVSTLWKLRRYIRDSLDADNAGKKIPAINKRFLESFGDDCHELLTRLGFKYIVDKDKEKDEVSWALPSSDSSESQRSYLQSWNMELQCLIERFCARDGDLNPCPDYSWIKGIPAMERILSAQGYSRHQTLRFNDQARQLDEPHFSSLGALSDFSDFLIAFCYDRQSDCDPMKTPHYYDCLQWIANSRSSEDLQIKASVLESQGLVGQIESQKAYKILDVDPSMTDNFIINKYRSRLEDTSPSVQRELKDMLQTLGRSRGSQLLLEAASDTLHTYEQALNWLGAENIYPDDSILTLHTTKIADNTNNTDLANKAVKIIADHRNSDMLHNWLQTGEVKDGLMHVDEACRHLNIDLNAVDETMLTVVIEAARSDNPGKRTDEAIEVVTRAYNAPDAPTTQALNTWPVGLTSHGNTCYLNSLLQYYFTIKPLRDIVLDFDQHKYDLVAEPQKKERVGNLQLRTFEIRAYQKFVNDLSFLFDRMIKDSTSAVKPEADLVCRAFLKAEDTEPQISSSAVSEIETEVKHDNDILMTTTESASAADELPSEIAQNAIEASSRTASVASSVTLAEPDMDSQKLFIPLPNELPPSPPASKPVSPIQEQNENLRPPLPPRHVTTPERQQTNLSKAEEAARQQQDVTEVMDEILFRLRAAIKPKGIDNRDEQLDLFRDIFSMYITTMTFAEGQKPASTDELAFNLLLNIPTEPTDIYSAIDEIFDFQIIDHGGKKISQYKTLTTLPPMLQINIPRNTYDPNLKRGVKVEHKMHLEDTLYMDRYVDVPGSNILELRKQCWEWRQRLRAMQAEKEMLTKNDASADDSASAMEMVADYMEGLGDINAQLDEIEASPIDLGSSISVTLRKDAEVVRTKLAAIDSRTSELKSRISAQFDGLEQMKYRLQAVFFHRGGYGHGHYWTYIHDFQNDIWRIYNDEKVEEFTKLDDIFNAETWQQGTPTYAVYVRDDLKDQYTEAVCRNPDTPPQIDEVMQDDPALATTSSQTDVAYPMNYAPPDYAPPEPRVQRADGMWESTEYNQGTPW